MLIDRSMLETLIRQNIEQAELQVLDPRGDGEQLAVTVAAPVFRGLTRLDQQRLVYEALAPLGDRVETLVLRTLIPDPSFPLSQI